MGMPRGGTTVTMDLFAKVPGVTLMDETSVSDLERAIGESHTVVWKSPHQCLNGAKIRGGFPDIPYARMLYIVRDGRDNLAGYMEYVEKYGVDPSFPPYQGPKGFARLWNIFAFQILSSTVVYTRLEDLVSDEDTLRWILSYVEVEDQEPIVEFAKSHLKYEMVPSIPYPRKAVRLGSLGRWRETLTDRQINRIDRDLLRKFGYE